VKRYGIFRMTNPYDLGEWSNIAFSLFIQVQVLDYAWRHFKRQGDKKSNRCSDEIKKVLRHVSECQTIAVRALVPDDVLTKCNKERLQWLYS